MKKPEEDTWGMRDYSMQQSVRILNNNPDMMNTPYVTCSCGSIIRRATDWYVMITNGILQCRWCAFCSSCWRDCSVTGRRLVCIDGLVLCHSCLQNFGYFIEPVIKVKIDNSQANAKLQENEASEKENQQEQGGQQPPDNAHNQSESKGKEKESSNTKAMGRDMSKDKNKENFQDVPPVLVEFTRKDRSKFTPQQDGRRPIRRAYYDREAARLPDERNPLIVAPPYDAYRGPLEKMTCPSCSKVATGSGKYVVPAMGRVYHKPCFACVSCKEQMNDGMRVAGKHFEFCTCEPPQAWCTRYACKGKRMAHHEEKGCWLGSLRPGGREQRDTDISEQVARFIAAEKSKKAQRS